MERTMLVNGRMPILGQAPAMAVLNHAGDPPDLFGYVGSCTAADAPDWRNPLPEDAVLDLEGALLLPGFCDLDIGLDRFSGESNEFYPAYRLAADALYRGVLSVGVRGDGQVLEALEGVANDYTLWAPQIARWNPDRIPSSYAVFYGAPEKGTREEEMYLQKVRRALRLGKIPGVATGKSPRERVNGLSPLVRAAELIHQGGYGKQEASCYREQRLPAGSEPADRLPENRPGGGRERSALRGAGRFAAAAKSAHDRPWRKAHLVTYESHGAHPLLRCRSRM